MKFFPRYAYSLDPIYLMLQYQKEGCMDEHRNRLAALLSKGAIPLLSGRASQKVPKVRNLHK